MIRKRMSWHWWHTCAASIALGTALASYKIAPLGGAVTRGAITSLKSRWLADPARQAVERDLHLLKNATTAEEKAAILSKIARLTSLDEIRAWRARAMDFPKELAHSMLTAILRRWVAVDVNSALLEMIRPANHAEGPMWANALLREWAAGHSMAELEAKLGPAIAAAEKALAKDGNLYGAATPSEADAPELVEALTAMGPDTCRELVEKYHHILGPNQVSAVEAWARLDANAAQAFVLAMPEGKGKEFAIHGLVRAQLANGAAEAALNLASTNRSQLDSFWKTGGLDALRLQKGEAEALRLANQTFKENLSFILYSSTAFSPQSVASWIDTQPPAVREELLSARFFSEPGKYELLTEIQNPTDLARRTRQRFTEIQSMQQTLEFTNQQNSALGRHFAAVNALEWAASNVPHLPADQLIYLLEQSTPDPSLSEILLPRTGLGELEDEEKRDRLSSLLATLGPNLATVEEGLSAAARTHHADILSKARQ